MTKCTFFSLIFLITPLCIFCQSNIQGVITDVSQGPLPNATLLLKNTSDSVLVKGEISNSSGIFAFQNIKPGSYFLQGSFIGMEDYFSGAFDISQEGTKEFKIQLKEKSQVMEEVQITAIRPMIEAKPDKISFNVQGTINSIGNNGLDLLRKAPGVMVDNNNNLSILGRSGVKVLIDGKKVPMSGDELTQFLQSLNSDQIDRIDIISNPGAKYDAEGTGGVIDIRMKKDARIGWNGSLGLNASAGQYAHGNINGNASYRNQKYNVFAGVNYGLGRRFNVIRFSSVQNNLFLGESNTFLTDFHNTAIRAGMDFFLSKNTTVGVLVNHSNSPTTGEYRNRTTIANYPDKMIDSILIADNSNKRKGINNSYNINVLQQQGKGKLNIDLDYGRYRNTQEILQPNTYYLPDEKTILTASNSSYDAPTDIDIYSAKADYELPLLGGNTSLGAKWSKVATKNSYKFYDRNPNPVLNINRSNDFDYDEKVLAGYLNYSRNLNAAWAMNAGVRVENTDATGNLKAYNPGQQEPPVEQKYTSVFPNAGITYQKNPLHVINLQYGRRINRPDYNVLNPFKEQLSELSFMKGNAFLRPEIVNNAEISYTAFYQYTITAGYSYITDQITRLIGPDDNDPRANFINWDNLNTQKIYSLNMSLPFDIKKWWSCYINLNGTFTDNQAKYEDGSTVDVQAYNGVIYQQQTFSLPKGYKLECSGWFSSPGVWGGVFLYDPSFSLDLGVQKKFWKDRMNVKLSVSDIFKQSYWSGVSEFDGLRSEGREYNDNRRVSLSVNYDFGNKKSAARKRKVGLEDEEKRLKKE